MKKKDKIGLGAVVATYSFVFLAAFLYGPAGEPHRSNMKSLDEWAAEDPVMKDLTFSYAGSESEEITRADVSGTLNVGSVPEFFAALVALEGKAPEPGHKTTLTADDVSADIDGTTFAWSGELPDAEKAADAEELYTPFVASEVEKLKLHAPHRTVIDAEVTRNMSVSDDDARAFRDKVYSHIQPHPDASVVLMGFPLAKPAQERGTTGVPGGEGEQFLLPRLQLVSEYTTYAELVEQAEHVDAASDMFLTSVNNVEGPDSEWTFYTEGEFDEEGLRAIKEILTEPVDGKGVWVRIEGPDGLLGTVEVGKPQARPESYEKDPWEERMQEVLGP